MSKDGRSNNQPPKDTQFKKGKSGNPSGRPKKHKHTFEDEIKVVFGKERTVQINGKTQIVSMRQLIMEQIATKAAQGDTAMIRLSLPLMKSMDDVPEFEILPTDEKALEIFIKTFNKDGSKKDES